MPSEIRHILFRPIEVVQAVKEFYKRTGRRLPPGNVVQCNLEGHEKDQEVGVRIHFSPDRASGMAEGACEHVVVAGARLVAALILFCQDRKIPLSAKCDKLLQLYGDQVCLINIYNTNRTEMPDPSRFRLEGIRLEGVAAR